MYEKIYVPVDNSEFSNQAIEKAVAFGAAFGAEITGCHVYAARMHDYRFKQMEFTLPGEYLLEDEIERQRRIHDSLITMGLQLISDSYLDVLDRKCEERSLRHVRKMMDGKHHVELVKDMAASGYDLTVMGALGVGRTRDSQIGTVCENVARRAANDVLVIKHLPKEGEPERDTILIGVDGSPQSFGAVRTGIELAKRFGKKVELIGVYDPYLHYAVFNSIVDVLSEKAAKVFRFEEQNQLHEEIIDCGLAQIYQSHLNVAEQSTSFEAEGVQITKTLLDGKAFQKVLARAREINPWLLIVGRIGVHSEKDEAGLGSNSENLLRLCPCDILLSTRIEHPELDIRANETILWTPEAEARMERVPSTVRGIARTGILRLAVEQGHSVVTNAVIDEAMDRFMPKYAAKATEQLAGTLVLEHAKNGAVHMCRKCGVTAAVREARTCAVCGGTEFDAITPEIVERIVAEEGGAEEEITYDGKKLRWSREAREQLLSIEDHYQKRRAKARIEKAARMKRLDTITLEFASAVIMDEVGRVLFDAPDAPRTIEVRPHDVQSDRRLIGIDDRGNEIRSVFAWTDDAVARLCKVPSGFMRERTQERIENLALEARLETIDLAAVDRAITQSKEAMLDALLSAETLPEEERRRFAELKEERARAGAGSAGRCPFSKLVEEGAISEQAAGVVLEANGGERAAPASNVYKGVVSQVLNEVGVMSELARHREKLKRSE